MARGSIIVSKDVIYNQLIATDTFELINSTELKNILLEMYNHLIDILLNQMKLINLILDLEEQC